MYYAVILHYTIGFVHFAFVNLITLPLWNEVRSAVKLFQDKTN
jgi:hypothetical protein